MLDTSRVRDLAHQLWEQQGRPIGHDLEHWLEAERRLSVEATAAEAEDKKPRPAKRADAAPKKKKKR